MLGATALLSGGGNRVLGGGRLSNGFSKTFSPKSGKTILVIISSPYRYTASSTDKSYGTNMTVVLFKQDSQTVNYKYYNINNSSTRYSTTITYTLNNNTLTCSTADSYNNNDDIEDELVPYYIALEVDS